jgi:UPF0716 family protein affecting phage T7 exclusion
VFGLLMLFPPTRALIRRLAMRRIGRRMETRVASAGERRQRDDWDVDGTASEHEPPQRRVER